MSQRKDTGLNINPWPKLVDHYKSASENINGDWVKVGEQLARTFFNNIETQK